MRRIAALAVLAAALPAGPALGNACEAPLTGYGDPRVACVSAYGGRVVVEICPEPTAGTPDALCGRSVRLDVRETLDRLLQ